MRTFASSFGILKQTVVGRFKTKFAKAINLVLVVFFFFWVYYYYIPVSARLIHYFYMEVRIIILHNMKNQVLCKRSSLRNPHYVEVILQRLCFLTLCQSWNSLFLVSQMMHFCLEDRTLVYSPFLKTLSPKFHAVKIWICSTHKLINLSWYP